jgi:hypothetical protein
VREKNVIKVEIGPTKVARVIVDAQHAIERTVDSATLILLEPFLQNIERELHLAMQSFLNRQPPANGKSSWQ